MENNKLIVLIIDDMVIFPNNEVRIEYDIASNDIINLIEEEPDKLMLIVNPLNNNYATDITALPKYAVLSRLKLKMNVPNGKTRVVLEGIKRVEITKYYEEHELYDATFKDIELVHSGSEDSYYNLLTQSLDHYINKASYMSNAILGQLDKVSDLDSLCDLVASFLPVSYQKKKNYIQTINPIERAKMLIEDMSEELKFIDLEAKIEAEVEQELNDQQKEYFLREKIKAMQKELGDVPDKNDEVKEFKDKLAKLKCSKRVKDKISHEISRYEATNTNSPELGMIRDYLDWMLNLPWNKYTKDNEDLNSVKALLDSTHYGLKDVKDRILEYLAVKQNTNNLRSPILCLVGPPGVGKTSLAQSIAKSLGRKVTKISVGGINDEAEIVGHRRTYIGANPGRIIQGIRKADSANPVFIIDEIDKMTKDIKGDPASSLLEVLDPEQNNKFSDHYIEEDFDLSKVFFIATANYLEQIPYELRDRLEIIEVPSYTEYEKLDIARDYLVPKELEQHGLTSLQINIDDAALLSLIEHYTKEAGVRELERVLASLLRKIVKNLLTNKKVAYYHISEKDLEKYLGKKKYRYMAPSKAGEVGVVNGMAYTMFGGDILPIEATYFKGKGDLILTGSLGDVMRESCQIALSYIKANAKKFNISEDLLTKNDIHLHFPEGAINKDGPSAGGAITTSLISVLTNTKVSSKLAMTGEITLRGKIIPIGGLREKVIGAHRAGIKEIILPSENEKDLSEIPEELKKDLTFIFVKDYADIYKEVFKKVA
jgi:ATP-dependent Lon protease